MEWMIRIYHISSWNEWSGYIISPALCLQPGHETTWSIRTEQKSYIQRFRKLWGSWARWHTHLQSTHLKTKTGGQEFKAFRRLHPALTLHQRNLFLQWSEVNTKKHQWSRSPDGTSITMPAKAQQTLRDRGKKSVKARGRKNMADS